MRCAQWLLQTNFVPLYLVSSERGLRGVFWDEQPIPYTDSLGRTEPEVKVLAQAAKQISEYLLGARKEFDLPLDIQGTEFQKRVWAELTQIPYGKTYSYSKVARLLGKENAVRAVGTANGKNPLCIIIPCHRVIAANGSLGGYSGGLDVKEALLHLESAHPQTSLQTSHQISHETSHLASLWANGT